MPKGDEHLSETEPCFLACTQDGMPYWRLVRKERIFLFSSGADNQTGYSQSVINGKEMKRC